jgi:hypothetical protein
MEACLPTLSPTKERLQLQPNSTSPTNTQDSYLSARDVIRPIVSQRTIHLISAVVHVHSDH